MSVSDLHSKFTFNSAHWLRILQQDHHHHVRSSFFSWWPIKLHQTNSRQKSFMRFLYSLLLGLLEFECEWCLLLLFFLFACHQQQTCSSATNLSGCALRGSMMMSIFVFSLWWFAWYSTFFVEIEFQKNNYGMCFWNLLSRRRNDTRTNKLFWWNF